MPGVPLWRRIVCSINIAQKSCISTRNVLNSILIFTAYIESNFKGMKDLNIRPQSPKTPRRRKYKEKALDASLGNDYFEEKCDIMSTVSKSRCEEISWCQIEKLQSSEGLGDSVQRQPRQWEKIFANHVTDNWPISKTNNQFLDFNGRNTHNFKADQEHKEMFCLKKT